MGFKELVEECEYCERSYGARGGGLWMRQWNRGPIKGAEFLGHMPLVSQGELRAVVYDPIYSPSVPSINVCLM